MNCFPGDSVFIIVFLHVAPQSPRSALYVVPLIAFTHTSNLYHGEKRLARKRVSLTLGIFKQALNPRFVFLP